ncbi:MltR family transcriptional regulator [Acerihabitans arboris]|uniref:MltR family transcriptional regulator n=1 Tax=Acerihabitans arboris TaxID=2691583 RepID=A0A845SHQ5_9GAMM|nr:MltR family transcriptional regulator [Acerihabitans arboris]NDL64683.1 MltR family transcriptional regulator [Acerihabitans arboris]
MTENTQLYENQVLEQLNAGTTVRDLMGAAVGLLAEAVNILVLQIFRKDDYAVKYAVEPLLIGAGPLGELTVRLKLVYALGVISRQEYEDAELLMALHEALQDDPNEYRFTDDEILGPFSELHCVTAFPPLPAFSRAPGDDALVRMQQQRYQQIVRSTMVLSTTEYLVRISAKKAFSDKLLLK